MTVCKTAGNKLSLTLLFLFFSLLQVLNSSGQNVGIGTNSPQTKLDIKGGLRTGGLNNFLLYDSLSGKFNWSNSYVWATAPQYLMMHSASAEGLHYANAQLEYLNSTGNPVFFTNWNNGYGYFSNRLGIGRTNPGFPLSFSDSLGGKISFYGDNTYHYGIGIQPYLMQIYSADNGSDIAFGHGSSFSFSENMRIKGNGNVGIGTSSPSSPLHIMQGSAGGNVPFGPLSVETNTAAYIGLLTPDASESGIIFGKNSDNASGGVIYNNALNPNGLLFRTNGNLDRVSVTSAGNVGVGTINPLARLHVAESSVLFSATGNVTGIYNDPPVSGQGRRMMWYVDKAAFRAGFAYGGSWDKDSIGEYSVATGNQTTAAGFSSTALGYKANASGFGAFASGVTTLASGDGSTAIGFGVVAKAHTSLSIGSYNDNTDNPVLVGVGPLDRIFQIGNGDPIAASRSNALTVLRNGKIGIGTTTPGFLLSFPDALGDKVSFWGTSANHYGIGIQSNQLQIHTDISASDIVFGIGSSASFTEHMRIKGTGKVGINTPTPQAELEVNGYTKMGSSAPKIQMKKLTGTTAASGGTGVSIAHGLTASKILSVDVLVEYAADNFLHHSYQFNPGYEFNFFITPTNITVLTINGSSGNILSKPFKILITYEQ